VSDSDTTEDDDANAEWLTAERRATLRRVGNVAGIVALVAVLVPVAVYLVPGLIGGEYSYVVLSGSMEPAMSPGDVTVVDAVPAAAIDRGDVINFQEASASRTTTHRVIDVVQREGERAFRTKGDNNEDPDQGVVTAGQVRGRVMTVGPVLVAIPLIGYLIQYGSTQAGFTLLFVLPLSLLVLNEVWTLVAAARTRESATDDPVRADAVATDGDPAQDAQSAADPDADAETDESRTEARPHTDEPDGGAVSFTAVELQLGLAILLAFVGYSVVMAALHPGVLTIGVAVSAGVALLMLGGMYLTGRQGSEAASERDTADVEADDD
jgi:signal peptidase